MALYCYLKNISFLPKRVRWYFRMSDFVAATCMMIGFVFLTSVILPFVLYQKERTSFTRPFLSPLVATAQSESNLEVSEWYPVASSRQPTKVTHYNLSIPRLGIDKAIVQINGEDLSKSLIQYGAARSPGEEGNTVIFGHSVLPQFFNPKNYKTIFSTIHTLKKDDEVLVDFDGIAYRYRVIEKIEVLPASLLSYLEEYRPGRFLLLVTCTPPGTYLRRLIVRTRLVSF